MRVAMILLALAGLSACNRNTAKSEQPAIAAKPAALAFDGATATDRAAMVAHGERLTWVLGCRGCHEKDLQGDRFYERYASNLTRELPKYSDTQIERVLRTGVPRDGRELFGMPSEIFQHLSDADMAALIAHLRALKPAGQPTQPPLPWTQEGKEEIAQGKIKPAAVFVREEKALAPVDLGPSHELGRYITRVTCAECHGAELKGNEGFSPDLAIVGGYSREQFEALMTTGVPIGGRKLRLMGGVARKRFTHFTPHERDALYGYLKARADRPEAAGAN